MPIDPQAQVILDMNKAAGLPPMHTLSPAELRARPRPPQPEPEPVARVVNQTISGPDGDIPVRIYWPEGDGPFPGVAFFHGGGWVICDLDTHDAVCRMLTNKTGAVVMSVDYRLAPEAKFPAASDDCYAATVWMAENAESLNVDASRIAVAGDSAGGNLAAVVALMARDQGGPDLVFQAMVYPVTDYSFDTPSYQENGDKEFVLGTDSMKYFWGHYLANEEDGSHPYASPLQAEDLGNLPPALVITAEFDPLRDEGEAYGRALQEAGVPTQITRYDGVFHGFFSMAAMLDKAKAANSEAAEALRKAFGN